ncbi:MAG: HAD family hydrolase [Bryobacteraceae bacterium]
MGNSPRRAFFFDRDGTLIVDCGYIRNPSDVELLPGVVETLAELRRRGFLLVVVSNQSGISRGLITKDEAQAVDGRFRELLEGRGIALDGVYECPHAPAANCDCRKPEPGMLLQAARELDIDLERSYMVGDKSSDCEAGARAGCWPVLIVNGSAPAQTAGAWTFIRNISDLLELI